VSYRVSDDSGNDKETHDIKSVNRFIPAQILQSTLDSPITYPAEVIMTSNPFFLMIRFIFSAAPRVPRHVSYTNEHPALL
jgi:hypothetical protein